MSDATTVDYPEQRVLSGIQPSGALHLGNYFGAVRQYLAFIDQGLDCYYFLANYHAQTSVRDRDEPFGDLGPSTFKG